MTSNAPYFECRALIEKGNFAEALAIAKGNLDSQHHDGVSRTLWYQIYAVVSGFLQQYAEAKEALEKAVGLDAESPSAQNNLAYLLATCPDESLHDSRKAVRHATLACQLTDWCDWGMIATLCAAQLRDGQFNTATATAERALLLVSAQNRWRVERLLKLAQSRRAFSTTVQEDIEKLSWGSPP